MTIMDVTKLDEGDYTCIAKNKAGETQQELSLRVYGKFELDLYIHTYSHTLYIHTGIILSENMNCSKCRDGI